jgi:hypothetical protein
MMAHQARDIGVVLNDKDFVLVIHHGFRSGLFLC